VNDEETKRSMEAIWAYMKWDKAGKPKEWKEDFRTYMLAPHGIPVQTFRGKEIDALGFVVWDGKLMRPCEILRDERYGSNSATGG